MAELEIRSPVTGDVLGTVAERDAGAAVEAARLVQPLWAAVPAHARAHYLRRAAQAVLDELDRLALLIARETGRPRSEALLAELLPSVSALHALADDGPRALADQRLGRPSLLRAGRRAVLVQAPAGVVGVRGRGASPWAEPVMESAASLLAGNAVLLAPAAPLAGERIAAAFIRAGVPGELIAVLHGAELDGLDRVVDLGADDAKATMLVLDGAPVDATVSGALWAAFAGAGRHPAAVGRLVVAPGPAEPLLDALVAGARRLRVGDPEHADTEVGPLASREDLEAVERLVVEAEAGGAERLCGGPLELPGLDGAFCAPIVLRGVSADARLLRELPPGPGAGRAGGGLGRGRRSRSPPSTPTRRSRCGPTIAATASGSRARWAPSWRGSTSTGSRCRRCRCGSPATWPRGGSPHSRRACAARAGCPTTRRSSARARPPPGCCTGARASAWRRCARARCRSPGSP